MRNKADHARFRRSPAFFWQLACVASGLGLVVFAGMGLAQGRPEGTSLSAAMYVIPLLLGVLGIGGGLKELRGILRPPSNPRAWLYKHVEQMFGAGIAFHTAFIVFGVNRLIGFQWPAGWALLPWIGPPVLGLVLTQWYVARLKMRTGDFPERLG